MWGEGPRRKEGLHILFLTEDLMGGTQEALGPASSTNKQKEQKRKGKVISQLSFGFESDSWWEGTGEKGQRVREPVALSQDPGLSANTTEGDSQLPVTPVQPPWAPKPV